MRKVLHLLFSRLVLVGIVILFQFVWIVLLVLNIGNFTHIIKYIFWGLSVIVSIWLINKRDNPAYKLAWIIPILLFPTLGGPLYLMYGNKKPARGLRKKLEYAYKLSLPLLNQDPEVIKDLENQDPHAANQAKYIANVAPFPVYQNSTTEYYRVGEELFESMVRELKKAKHFIFMEYFIIEEGYMWDTILNILMDKASQGVEVRLIYDDVGCVNLLPYHYYEKLSKCGIRCVSFNHFIPVFSVAMNNRDHRKITVIDGHTSFSGGVNIADEYINKKVRFGHWKDTGIMVKGEATWNFTVMFLQMWNTIEKTDMQFDYYKPYFHHVEKFESNGYVQPYGDSPLDEEIVGENVYLNIINDAKQYVYMCTPYLIIDNEMMTALCLAAKKGVDVRIITPGIPDKKTAFLLTQSYYLQLLDAGVRIFQYTPGFVHAKCMVSDDETATVGTINLDFRSLYLHFECGVWMHATQAVLDVRDDMLSCIRVGREIHPEDCTKNWILSIWQSILRVIAPLM